MTQTTYDQVGAVEDMSDVIATISPTKTPIYSMLPKRACKAVTVEWMDEDLVAANPDNALSEGGDPTPVKTQPNEYSNKTQIFEKTVKTSGTARAVGTYGRADELARQLELRGKELKRDIEAAICSRVQAPVAGAEGGAGRKMGSFYNFMHADNKIAATTTFTEANVNSALKAASDAGGDPAYLFVSPTNAEVVAGFATATGRQRDYEQSTTLVNVIDYMVTPHGSVEVVQDQFIGDAHVLALDPDYAAIRELRGVQLETLAKTGDADTRMLLTELTLEVSSTKAHGAIIIS